MWTGCANSARTTSPPMKSIPRLRPRYPVNAIEAAVAISDSTSARLRQRMKSRLVWSGTSLSSFMRFDDLDVQFAGTRAADPQRDQHAGEIDGGEHRGHNTDQQHDGEAADG